MAEAKTCRCCGMQGGHKDLYATYNWMNRKEIYGKMLRDCFNIVLSTAPQHGSVICDSCVSSLRAADAFKRLVLQAEEQLMLSCEELDVKLVDIKMEPKIYSDGDDSDDYFLADTIRDEQNTKVKAEFPPVITIKKGQSSKKSKKAASKKTSDETGTWNAEGINDLVSKLTSIGNNELTIKKKKDPKVAQLIKCSDSRPRTLIINPKIMWGRSYHDKKKHRDNLITILQHSNVTPFKDKSLLGYICAYCDKTFPDPLDLRTHTHTIHTKERLNFKSSFDMTDYSAKFDILDLTCTICERKFDNLGGLKEHLSSNHNKTIHNDIKDHMLQFKLKKGEIYDCAMCTAQYETFKMLKQHMNKHYSNYACPKCDSSFATKRSLTAHKATHLEGNFKCEYCEKVFPSKAKKHYHEKSKHMGTRHISNCPYCNEPFRSYYQRNQHLIKVHNTEAQYKCNICNKSYILKSLLMYHIKKSHLMERNCQCSECGYRFFSKKALKAHMVKHTGERNFTCPVCQKAYARKYTLREHMRIHNNDRRFKCDVCAMSFVQKCSLKSHLLSNHGISLAASDINIVGNSANQE